MARKPEYALKKGETRTPEEHRRILAMIDAGQTERSEHGKAISRKRIKNTFGVSKAQYQAKSAPKKKKREKLYDVGRFCRE